MTAVYEAGTIKRNRSTKTEMHERHKALCSIVADAAPTGVRFCYYRAVSQSIVPKTDNGYRMVQRALMHLRETGIIPWTYIVDSSRWMRKPETWSSGDELLHEVARTYRRSN
jgi:alkylated DNA nucleotide flippase Atl1